MQIFQCLEFILIKQKKMEFNNVENKSYIVDGQEIWHSRSVAVVGMVLMLHEEEIYVLLGKRGKALPNAVGKWCMPCGYLDWDETTEDAVVREIWEESGFNVYKAMNEYRVIEDRMDYPWKIHSDPTTTPLQNISLHYAIYFSTESNEYRDVAKLPDVTFENNTEHPNEVDEVRWVKVNELRNYEMAFNHDTTIRVFISNLPLEMQQKIED